MKCTKSDQAYKWHDGRQWHVGKLVTTADPNDDASDDPLLVTKTGVEWQSYVNRRESILVQHSHTGELEFVEWSKLSVYPSEPIPEPSTAASARGE